MELNLLVKSKVYLVATDAGETGNFYWMQYESLEDAVSDQGDGCEVFVAEPKPLGRFKRKAESVKIKVRKKRKSKRVRGK